MAVAYYRDKADIEKSRQQGVSEQVAGAQCITHGSNLLFGCCSEMYFVPALPEQDYLFHPAISEIIPATLSDAFFAE